MSPTEAELIKINELLYNVENVMLTCQMTRDLCPDAL